MRVLDIFFLILGLLLLFVALAVLVLFITYWERKVLGRIQRRLGPMRVGPHGILQPVADAVKLVLKEDLMPAWSDKAVFWLAPMVTFVPVFLVWLAIPTGRTVIYKIPDAGNVFELGLFYVIAVSTVSIMGMVMAGWSSGSKYATLGGLRSAAQLISYEIPTIMVAISVGMLAQSINLEDIANAQIPGTVARYGVMWAHVPFILVAPLGLVIFLLASLAEAGRTPFDIYTAESELVGGPFVEYSGAHWAAFYLVEYLNTILIGALVTLLFLGGWHGPLLPGWLWFLIKTIFVVTLVIWIRGTLPRFRVDQLMSFAWKMLIPLSFLNVVVTAIYLFYGWPTWSMSLMSLAMLGGAGYILYRKVTVPAERLAAQTYRRAAPTGSGPSTGGS